MKQDARIAARQEWTSWKQWALSHPDWPSFKTDAVAAYRDSLVEAEAWEEDPNNHEAFRTAIAEGKARDAEEVKRGIRLALAVLAALAGGCRVSAANRSPKPNVTATTPGAGRDRNPIVLLGCPPAPCQASSRVLLANHHEAEVVPLQAGAPGPGLTSNSTLT